MVDDNDDDDDDDVVMKMSRIVECECRRLSGG